MKNCLKCGHQKLSTDLGPDYLCPKCGAVYAKVEAAIAEKARQHEAAKQKLAVKALSSNEGEGDSTLLSPPYVQSDTTTRLSTKGANEKFCSECASVINAKAEICPKCGVRQVSVMTVANDSKTLAKASGAEKKVTSGFVKGVLYITGIGLVSSLLLPLMAGRDRGAESRSAVAASEPKPSSDDICRNDGDAIATAYFANIKGAVEAGLVSSEMMRTGCQQKTASRGSQCFELCQDGFKYRAQQWVKNK